jgi:hypothetical protein
MTVVIVITALSISVAYSVYHYRERLFSSILLANEKKQDLKKSVKEDFSFTDHKSELKLQNSELTAISEDFFKLVDSFKWEKEEREDFIREMLALNPFERNLILKEMIKKTKSKK